MKHQYKSSLLDKGDKYLNDKLVLSSTFFPVLRLEKVHKLTYGLLGSLEKLKEEYRILTLVGPIIRECKLDGRQILNPVFGVASKNPKKFNNEIEIIKFLFCSEVVCQAADEIFGQTVAFEFYQDQSEYAVKINDAFTIAVPKRYRVIRFRSQDVPFQVFRWDTSKIDAFEPRFEDVLQNPCYLAIVKCLSDSEERETQKERERMVISLNLFNQAFINLSMRHTSTALQLIFVASAFEAMLNLPTEDLRKSFHHSIATLIGKSTKLLRDWAQEFYDYRCSLMHGGTYWNTKDSIFKPLKQDHVIIAKKVFIHCLRVKLYLMGHLDANQIQNKAFEEIVEDCL